MTEYKGEKKGKMKRAKQIQHCKTCLKLASLVAQTKGKRRTTHSQQQGKHHTSTDITPPLTRSNGKKIKK
jgi:hypothetical protein